MAMRPSGLLGYSSSLSLYARQQLEVEHLPARVSGSMSSSTAKGSSAPLDARQHELVEHLPASTSPGSSSVIILCPPGRTAGHPTSLRPRVMLATCPAGNNRFA